jgi:hypothetical protein
VQAQKPIFIPNIRWKKQKSPHLFASPLTISLYPRPHSTNPPEETVILAMKLLVSLHLCIKKIILD